MQKKPILREALFQWPVALSDMQLSFVYLCIAGLV